MTIHFVADSQLMFKVMTFDGKQIHIHFSERDSTGTSSFLTQDEKVANAIRSHSFYKKGRIIEATIQDDQEDDQEETQAEEVIQENDNERVDENIDETAETVTPEDDTNLSFPNITIAKDYLHRTYGVDKNEIRSIGKIIAFGQSKGVNITINKEE